MRSAENLIVIERFFMQWQRINRQRNRIMDEELLRHKIYT